MPSKYTEARREFYRKREASKRQKRIEAGLNSRGQQRREHFIPNRRKDFVTRTDEELDREALAWLNTHVEGQC